MNEPKRIHPVTFFDRQSENAVEEGVADFRPWYDAVPKAATIGPPTHPGLRQTTDTADVATVGDSEPVKTAARD